MMRIVVTFHDGRPQAYFERLVSIAEEVVKGTEPMLVINDGLHSHEFNVDDINDIQIKRVPG